MRSTRPCARRLAPLLGESGNIWPAVAGSVRLLPPRVRKIFLRQLLDACVREQRERRCILEYAGRLRPAAEKALERSLGRELGRPITLRGRENPQLIAGVRVTVGDRRWERSLRLGLERFCSG
jgi:hypothetical protein